MKIIPSQGDPAILTELGARLMRRRLDLQLTQAELAHQAGLGKRTLERMEGGGSVQLTNLIRVLRALGLLDALDALLPEPGPRPMDLLKLKGHERRRATGSRKRKPNPQAWNWGAGNE